jgi:DNA-directed RNA polymerase subunit K/omega
MGAPVLLDVPESLKSPIELAELELQEEALPISIRRSLPDGTSLNIPLNTLLEGEREEAGY